MPILNTLSCMLAAAMAFAADPPGINMPPGRIAMTFDGNHHSKDDIGGLPIAAVMVWAAGLSGRVVHLEINNHLGDSTAAQESAMVASASGSVSRFGIPAGKVFDARRDLAGSIANFKAEAERSTAGDPLWLICAGPMETAWQCINAVDPGKRQFIRAISHSDWNETHYNGDNEPALNKHYWSTMKADFPTVVFYDILNQNRSNGDFDFSTPDSAWHWLRDSNHEPYRWVFSRDDMGSVFDVSDAGMAWFLISGGPQSYPGGESTQQAQQKGGWRELKTLLEWRQGVGVVNQAPVATAGPDSSVILPSMVSLDRTRRPAQRLHRHPGWRR